MQAATTKVFHTLSHSLLKLRAGDLRLFHHGLECIMNPYIDDRSEGLIRREWWVAGCIIVSLYGIVSSSSVLSLANVPLLDFFFFALGILGIPSVKTSPALSVRVEKGRNWRRIGMRGTELGKFDRVRRVVG